MANTYSTGTLAVTSGSKAVTISGGLSIAINMKPGDFIAIEGGLPNAIESLTDATHFVLVREFDGPDDPAASYVVIHMPAGWGDRIELNEQTAEVIRLLGQGVPTEGAIQSAIDAASDAEASMVAAAQSEALAGQFAADAAAAGSLIFPTWAALSAVAGIRANQRAEVVNDAGTHIDPIVGGTVVNGGVYSWSLSPLGWRRIAETGIAALEQLVGRSSAASLFDFKDKDEKAIVAQLLDDGSWMITGIGNQSLQEAIRNVQYIEDDQTTGSLVLVTDSESNPVLDISQDGEYFIPNIGARSLQDAINLAPSGIASLPWVKEPTPSAPIVTYGPSIDFTINDRVPLITMAPAGEMTGSRHWAAWYSNDLIANEGGGNYVVVAYSDDAWATPVKYAAIQYDDPTLRVFDPQLWTDPTTGILWVFFAVGGNSAIQDGIQGAWAVTIKNPEGDVPNFSAPFVVSPIGVPMAPKVINEQPLIPIDNWIAAASKFPNLSASRVFFLDTQHRTARKLFDMPKATAFTTYAETNIAQAKDGSLIGAMRTTGRAQITRSTNGGKTWSTPVEWSALGNSPSSRLWVGTSPSGRLVVAYNNSTEPTRSHMTLAISEDGGATFPHSVLLDARDAVSYPSVYFDDAGNICTVYDRSRTGAKEINVARVSEQDMLSGSALVDLKIITAG
jgi:hypothetical protein